MSFHGITGSDTLETLKPVRWSYTRREWRRPHQHQRDVTPPSSIRILTWNIDFATPNPGVRLQDALKYIQQTVFDCKDIADKPGPCCILLQEIHIDAFDVIAGQLWLREHFLMAPSSPEHFHAHYGLVTLISKDIPVLGVHDVTFGGSTMGRSSLMVDLRMLPIKGDRGEQKPVTLRVANTHLESLPIGAAQRPVQLATIAARLKDSNIYTGIVCGDMNSIGESDRHIHKDVGLKDAWTGGDEDEAGYTWGYQPRCRFPVGRLDKILYTRNGHSDVRIGEPERVGVGAKTSQGQWVSDHYGLITSVAV
ncbi:hypothetical protein K474DRAFT_1659971 [Panus rudis PR-1116 ss-1]|nr:hypothetical protein K474DRAFT_1659971 [Panus rudis PR-1116 ss-1]